MLLLAAIAPGPSATATARIYIEKRYGELNRAVSGMNADRISKWMTENAAPKFYYRAGTGKFYSADQTVALMRSEFNATESVKSSDYRMTNFSFHGHQAHCSVTSHLVVILAGHKRVVSDSTSVDSWTQKNGKWKIDSIVTTGERQGG